MRRKSRLKSYKKRRRVYPAKKDSNGIQTAGEIIVKEEYEVSAIKIEDTNLTDDIQIKCEDKVLSLASEIKSENKEQQVTQNVENSDVQTNCDNEIIVREECEVQAIKVKNTNGAGAVQIKFDARMLFCENCHEFYQDCCTTCGKLIHILDTNASDGAENKAREEIPKDLLDINESSDGFGIFSLRPIPAGVKFGPFTGLHNSEGVWKIFRGKFVVSDGNVKFPHWLQYINSVNNTWEQNLRVFQCNKKLYYSSVREILEGEELFVYFGEICQESCYDKMEMNFIPEEKDNENVFACTYCCLGFNSLIWLVKHKNKCGNGMNGKTSIEVIVHCSLCDISMEEGEYLNYHKNYCMKRNTRQSAFISTQLLSASPGQTAN